MNRAIFVYTLFIKARSLPVIFTLLFFSIIMPIALSQLAAAVGNDMVTPLVLTVTQTASIPLVMAFVLQKDTFADTRNLSDGEYLSLIFTRPLTRAEYVVSKWLAAAFCVAFALILQMLVFHASQVMGGRRDDYLFNGYHVLDIIFQSLSAAAVVSVINAIPRRLGVWIFMILSYSALIVQTPLFEPVRTGSTEVTAVQSGFEIYAALVNALLSNRINSFDLLLSDHPDWGALVGFVSNIALYLLFAVYVLNKREFFYASQ
jgi:hypothetical protein